MTPEELARLSDLVRANIMSAGYNINRIEREPLEYTARWIHESRLAIGPYPMALAYQAITWMLAQQKPKKEVAEDD